MGAVDDLLVTVEASMLIFSDQEIHEIKSMFLTNLDQVVNFDVQTVTFFAANPNFPPEVAFKKIRNALQKLLAAYEFLSGRIKTHPDTGRLEFDCNNAGVGFVVARSERTLDELGDLVYPNPAFEQLFTLRLDNLSPSSHPLCIFQMTSFKCGGFAMGVQRNHAMFDGISALVFAQNLAALAGDKELVVTPCNDRKLLAARSPLLVSFPHHECLKLNILQSPEATDNVDRNVLENSSLDLSFKIFHLSPDGLLSLKAKASSGSSSRNGRITSFNVVSAHIWRCKALCCDLGNNLERDSTLLYPVNFRQRLNPPLPVGYTGNAVLSAYARAKCRDIAEAPLSRLVDMVAEGAARMTDQYVRSAIDYGETNKMFPIGDFMISSWWKLGFNEVEYPWGKPIYRCPLISKRKDIILLLPDIASFAPGGNGGGGVNVWVSLPHQDMNKFESLFYKHLSLKAVDACFQVFKRFRVM
ncbi:Acyltransferase GLAUCE-like protein [Drosera capensis]